MRHPRWGALAVGAALLVSACGETYLETSATTLAPDVTTTTLAAVDPGAPVADLLAEIKTLMFDLDQRVIDGNEPAATLDRIEALWGAAEPRIRETALDSVYQFEVALDLARSGVRRNRPADASKGYKLMQQVVAAFAA
ncbi:MAG TPA: hypothetical protein VNQ73_21465 [Ilumatobacter sp.]|nr:hypothetical protein [Ilumatobacter sp.]